MENETDSHIALSGNFPDFPVFYKVLVCYEWEVLFASFEKKEKQQLSVGLSSVIIHLYHLKACYLAQG